MMNSFFVFAFFAFFAFFAMTPGSVDWFFRLELPGRASRSNRAGAADT